MQISVDLQSSFVGIYVFLFLIVTLICVFSIYIFLKKLRNRKELEKIEIKQVSVNMKQKLKQMYIKKLEELKEKVNKQEIDARMAYQDLSLVIRHFVYDITGIKVQNYTLREIKKTNLPMLYELIKEYYKPEFAKIFKGNIVGSIDKAREVIEKWN